ncbi:MAG: metallophosphoesterase [Oscillospiraceae bacterium]|nr:metallophosphoesterase [Oscillospiraceae bacterium]
MKKHAKLALVLLLMLALLPTPLVIAANKPAGKTLTVAVLSDIHLFPEAMTGNNSASYQAENGAKPAIYTEGLLKSALAAVERDVKRKGIQFLLVPGDLTRDGEYEGHTLLAKYLNEFEKKTGVQVAVINGNHDIHNSYARTYADGKSKAARKTTPQDFCDIYKDLGYDLPNLSRYRPPRGAQGGGLTYAADLGKNYRLIAIDGCKYTPDYTDDSYEHKTGGRMSPAQFSWVLTEIETAREAGKTVIGIMHHNLTEHLGYEGSVFQDFMIEDFRKVRGALADAGLHFMFTGHTHIGEIGEALSDDGEKLYDICTAAVMGYPNTFREVVFATEGKKITAAVTTHAVDEALPVTVLGETYPKPYAQASFRNTYGTPDGWVADFAACAIKGLLASQLADARLGKLTSAIASSGVDKVDRAVDIAINALFSFPVSDLPCTAFLKTYGFGSPGRPGTFEDFVNSTLIYMYGRDQGHEPGGDAFYQDALKTLESGVVLDQLFDALVSVLTKDLPKEFTPLLACLAPGDLLQSIFDLALGQGRREAINRTLNAIVNDMVAKKKNYSDANAVLVYSGRPEKVIPTRRDARLPININVAVSPDNKTLTVTWDTLESVAGSDLRLTLDGKAVEGLRVTEKSSVSVEMLNKLDIGFTQIMGEKTSVRHHTVTASRLVPGREYQISVGDAQRGWWSEPEAFTASWPARR